MCINWVDHLLLDREAETERAAAAFRSNRKQSILYVANTGHETSNV